MQALFVAHGVGDEGLLELQGQLVPEHENPSDPNAIAVHVEGALIGYLPGYLAARAPQQSHGVLCRVQLWATSTDPGLRVRGWVSLGTDRAAWPHSPSNPPAVTAEERRLERAADITDMVASALEGGGERAREFEAGMVDGYHYLETIEPIKQLKRYGRLEEALRLCYGAIAAAENARGALEPPPWYTEQAAIIHRKLGQQAEERAVLQRWLAACPPERRPNSRIAQRLNKLG